jgi:cytochrome c553
VWNAICGAAGLVREAPAPVSVVPPTFKTSGVIVTPRMLHDASAVSIGRGATLALRCTMCHGARGMSQANSPNLAGQYAAVVYKELRDYKSGARSSAIMQPLVVGLSDQDMRDLAVYYDYLPRPPAYHPASAGQPPEIVVSGAPMRNIPPCAACHGGLDNKAGSPWLDGQPAPYIKAQLQAFADGTRRNDISEQMRNVARNMTPDEIDAAARYYSSQPP